MTYSSHIRLHLELGRLLVPDQAVDVSLRISIQRLEFEHTPSRQDELRLEAICERRDTLLQRVLWASPWYLPLKSLAGSSSTGSWW